MFTNLVMVLIVVGMKRVLIVHTGSSVAIKKIIIRAILSIDSTSDN